MTYEPGPCNDRVFDGLEFREVGPIKHGATSSSMNPYKYQLSALLTYYRHSILTNVPIFQVTSAQMIKNFNQNFYGGFWMSFLDI